MLVIIPHFNEGQGSAFVDRYASLGDDGAGVTRTLLTRPWEAAELVASYDRLSYLVALLAPLAFLSLAAPLLAAGALPEVLINVLADWFPQYSIEFQYVAVIVPFLVAASILGLARLRRAERPAWLVRALERDGAVAAVWVALVLVSGVYLGPLPWWGAVPAVGSDERTEQYRLADHAAAAARAVAMIPDDVPVSAGNLIGAHLSERERILTFPVVGEAQWVIVDRHRPYLGDRLLPAAHAGAAGAAAGAAGHAPRARRRRRHGVPPGARGGPGARDDRAGGRGGADGARRGAGGAAGVRLVRRGGAGRARERGGPVGGRRAVAPARCSGGWPCSRARAWSPRPAATWRRRPAGPGRSPWSRAASPWRGRSGRASRPTSALRVDPPGGAARAGLAGRPRGRRRWSPRSWPAAVAAIGLAVTWAGWRGAARP